MFTKIAEQILAIIANTIALRKKNDIWDSVGLKKIFIIKFLRLNFFFEKMILFT